MGRDTRSGRQDQGRSNVNSGHPDTSRRVAQDQSPPIASSLTAQQLFYHVKEEILSTVGSGYLHYEHILPHIGYQVARSLASNGDIERKSTRISYNPTTSILCVTMPTQFHETQMSWAWYQMMTRGYITGCFSLNELGAFVLAGGARFDNFPNPWQNIYKEPDLFIRPFYAPYPTIVFETGYSESYRQLVADKDLWFNATSQVNVVVLIKWTKVANNRIRGFLELWHRGAAAAAAQRIQIFPIPAPGTQPQFLTFLRQDFYVGGIVPLGRQPLDPCSWDIDEFRRYADEAIRGEGLVPE